MPAAPRSLFALPPQAGIRERIAVVSILFVAAGLRIYGITSWLLANVDEVSALNQYDPPFLSGATTSSNYLLTTTLLKTVGWLLPFPFIRILTALASIGGLFILYRAFRGLVPGVVAVLTLVALTLSWNGVYYARLFECGSFTPAIACFFMACVVMWLRRPDNARWLFAAGGLLGIHFNTHAAPCFYAMIVFSVFLAWQLRRRLLSPGNAIATVLAFGVGTLPYVYTSLAYPHFDSALGTSYGTLAMAPAIHWAINFRHPTYLLRTLTEYLTFYPLPEGAWVFLGFGLFCLVIVLVGTLVARASPLKAYLALMTFGSIVVIGLSPVPVYNEGHLHFFWPHFLALLSLLIYQSRHALKVVLSLVFVSMLALNVRWLPRVIRNQVAEVETVLARDLTQGETVYISDGAMLKLKWLDLYRTLETHPLVPFVCQGPEAMQPFTSMNLKQKSLVLVTSDAPWPPPSFAASINDVLLLSQEQLMEAYQSHGLRVYEIRPFDPPAPGPNAPAGTPEPKTPASP